jgi:hypothetical protein
MNAAGGRDTLLRDTAAVCLVLAAAAAAMYPVRWRIAAGVLSGGLLVLWSAWAIRGVVDVVLGVESAGRARRRALVKFFTRHAILALGAYGMMARLRVDPVGMLVGVTALPIALGAQVFRELRGKG